VGVDWRIRAKYATVCPLCRGYIGVGAWIVQPDACNQWAHAVCPKDAQAKRQQPAEPTTYEVFNPETGEFETHTLEFS
jgi:hypothetical protein